MRFPLSATSLILCLCLCLGIVGCNAPAAPPLYNVPLAETPLPSNPKQLEQQYLSAAEVHAKHEWEAERGIRFPKLVRGNLAVKDIALTFDDGPHPLYTQKLLDILKQENVKATFFVVGKMVGRHPELVQQEAAEGHEVANHTFSHLRLPTIPPQNIEPELRNGALAIQKAIGEPTKLFRPPGGEYDDDVIKAAQKLGYVMVLWTDDPGDYASPGERRIEDYTLKYITNGGIILLHDGVQQTLDILPDLIRHLKAQGYRFVTRSKSVV